MVLVTTFADNSSGLGALGVDGRAFIVQLITFVLAYFVLRRYAFGPILKVLHERRETIENGVKLGEQMKRQQSEMEAKVEKALHESRKKADAIIADAHQTGLQTVRESEEKARIKAEGIIRSAEDQIKQEANRSRTALEKELIGLIADVSEAVIEEKIDGPKDIKLIERALKDRQDRQPA